MRAMSRWAFGDFVLDVGTRELRRGASPVALSPKAFDLLAVLVAGAPQAVSKADIQDRLWPGTFVVEKNVTNLVSEIRAALDDPPSRPRFIRTVPRFGYAFTGDPTPEGTPAPTAAPAEWPRHNLPAPLTSFVGRDAALAEVTTLVPSTRLLTLAGAGGCGKTRLAIEVARGLVDRFRHGVWLADLAPLADDSAVPQAVASLFDIRHDSGRPLRDTIGRGLRGQQVLLVLDNCEHVVDACAALAQTLLDHTPDVVMLVTSREPLGIAGETVWRVPSLAMPQHGEDAPAEGLEPLGRHGAIALFVDRARAVDRAFTLTPDNAAAVVEICRRLDGIPLAIELAAARLRVLSIDQIRERLHDRFTLLTGGSRTVAARQRTLEATLDWSYQLLSRPEQRLLRRLAVFARDCTIESAEAVCAGGDIERADVLELVSRLADRSLVSVESGPDGERRYRLLETVRHYARMRLLDDGEIEAIADRHLALCLDRARRAGQGLSGRDQVVWFRRVAHEYDDFRAGLEWSLTSSGRARHGLETAAAMSPFWIVRGAFAEGQRWLEQLLAACPEPPAALRAAAALGLGQAAFFRGDLARAGLMLDESAAFAREGGDAASEALALGFRALAALESGDAARGVPLAKKAAAIGRRSHAPWVQGPAVSLLAYCALEQGDDDRAATLYEQVLELGRTCGHQWGIGIALADLALLRVVQQRPGDAGALSREAIGLFRELGDRWGIALGIGTMAGAEAVAARWQRAATLYGAMQGLLDGIRAPVQASFTRWVGDRSLARAADALGTEAWNAALADGRAMSPARAIAYALATPGS
jgi:non-specific serine/threonine protein kinase